jgi:hypothetical protein
VASDGKWTIFLRPDGQTVMTLSNDDGVSEWQMSTPSAARFFAEGHRAHQAARRPLWRVLWDRWVRRG